jgi:hypothetical protein
LLNSKPKQAERQKLLKNVKGPEGERRSENDYKDYGEGQYRAPEALCDELKEIDNRIVALLRKEKMKNSGQNLQN